MSHIEVAFLMMGAGIAVVCMRGGLKRGRRGEDGEEERKWDDFIRDHG